VTQIALATHLYGNKTPWQQIAITTNCYDKKSLWQQTWHDNLGKPHLPSHCSVADNQVWVLFFHLL